MPRLPSLPPQLALPPLARARVTGAYASTAVETARELGADLERLGTTCNLPGLGKDLGESLPAQRYLSLLEAAAAQLGDPAFGLHVGERRRLPAFPGYGLLFCASKDYRTALQQAIRFGGLAHDLGRSELVERKELAHLRWHTPWLGQPGCRHLVESVLAAVRALADWLGGARLQLLDVAFTHPAPAGVPLEEYRRVFRAPVRFGAEANELRLPADFLDAPVASAEPSLFPTLVRELEQRLAARQREAHEPPIVPAVRERIQEHLKADTARLHDVAAALGLTGRTLQRKLGEARLTFSALLDVTRRELAQQYLLDPSLSMAEIAYLLGFREQSSFNHAFRGWFGTTPAAWRARRSGK